MKVRIDPHTRDRAKERGTTESEIREVIEAGDPVPSKCDRIGRSKVFEFNKERLGRYYAQKRVEVHYVLEGDEAVTVTVYVFYGKWEG